MSFWADRSPLFDADFDRQAEWYLVHANAEVARRFQEKVDETIQRLLKNPTLGHPRHFRHPQLRQLRSFQVNSPFDRFLLFYRMQPTHLEFVRLMEGSRDLGKRLVELG